MWFLIGVVVGVVGYHFKDKVVAFVESLVSKVTSDK